MAPCTLDGLTAGERVALQRALEEPLGGALWRNTDDARKAAVRGTARGGCPHERDTAATTDWTP